MGVLISWRRLGAAFGNKQGTARQGAVSVGVSELIPSYSRSSIGTNFTFSGPT
jgi:hypothetical protein